MTAPLYLHFQLTERCNLACPGCYLPERTGPGAAPDAIEKTVFAPLAAAGVRFVTLTGGEPLLHPRWREICAAAARHFESVQLVCNGTLLDVAAYEALAAAGIKAIKVSLDGPVPAIHDTLRGMPGCFERITANLRAIAALPPERRGGIDLGCICTVYPQNVGFLRETADFVASLGLDSMLFQPFHPFGCLYPPPAKPEPSVAADQAFLTVLDGQLERLRALRRTRPAFLDNRLGMLDRFPEFYTDPAGPDQTCGADRFVFVNSGFEVRGCLFCQPLGSLREKSLTALRQGDAWRGFDAFRSRCRRCLMGCQFVDKAQELVEAGFARLDVEDYAGARPLFEASLALECSVSAMHGAGLARLHLGEGQEVRRLLEAALALQPKNPVVRADLGWVLLAQNEPDAAREAFDASLVMGYTAPAGHGAGLARLRLGDAAGARPFLEEARRHRPNHLFILMDLGSTLLELGQWDALTAVCEHLCTIAPDSGIPYRLRGLAARRRGDLQAALPDLRIGMEAGGPNDPWPAFDYGLVCLEAGQPVEAVRTIRLAIARDPNFPWFRYRLAQALTALGRRSEARQACREAIRLDAAPEAFHQLLAELDADGEKSSPPLR